MSMHRFDKLFPHVPSWTIRVGQDAILPEGQYGFLEYYCGNPECRCQACEITVVKVDAHGSVSKDNVADIYYAWDKPWSEKNPRLVVESAQSDLANDALKVFTALLQQDPQQLSKLQSHYEMVKDYFDERIHLEKMMMEEEEPIKKIGRNDLCPCGSGKKYKKCCL